MVFAPLRSFGHAFLRRTRMERDMESELAFHIDARADDLVAAGLDRAAAVRQARQEFGDPVRWKEQGREARGLALVDQLRADVRYGLRWLCRSPSFTVAAVVTMAVGIGANTAIFSLVNAVLLRLAPVDDPRSLVLLARSDDRTRAGSSFPYPFFAQLQNTQTLQHVIARASFEPNLHAGGAAERIQGELVSGNYFEALGVAPHIGRLLTPADDRDAGREPVAVLSYDYWRRRFGEDPNIVGRMVRVNASILTVIGVTPPSFGGIELGASADIRVPLAMQAALLGGNSRLENPREWWLGIIGRLKPGVRAEAAAQELDAIFQRFATDNQLQVDRRLLLLDGSRGRPVLQNRFAQPLAVLSALAAAVLLLVCLNVANLMLARTSARRRELSVRLALGATRPRIFSQLAVETLLIAAAGGAVGVLLAQWTAQAVAGLALSATATAPEVSIDTRVLVFATGLSLATGLACAIWPAVAAQRIELAAALSVEGRSVTSSRYRARQLLVAAQIALSFVLVVGAGLFARTLLNLRDLDVGFDAQHLLSFRVDPTLSRYEQARIPAYYDEVCEQIAALPGVRSVSFAAIPLLNRNNWGSGITLDTSARDEDPGPDRNAVGARYFATVGVPLVAGREFTDADVASSPKVAVVNEAFAEKYFGGRAIGRRIGPASAGQADVTIVGVVRNGKYADVRETPAPFWYVPYRQLEPLGQTDTGLRVSQGILSVHVRTAGDPASTAATIRQAVAAVDPRATVFDVKTMEQQVAEQLVLERLLAALATGFAAIAILLAALGLYGVTAYDTAARTREIAVRMALGATPFAAVALILRQTTRLIAAGLTAGLILTVAGVRYVRSLLFGLQPGDPSVVIPAVVLVIAVTALAAWLPARRATRIAPATALQ